MAAKLRVSAVSGLARERLDPQREQLWSRKLGLVVAPAGSGKTTLLAHWAAAANAPVAWYRAEPSDGDPTTLLGYLEAALCGALQGLEGDWANVEEAARQLDRWSGDRALLVVDDLHALQGTPAEAMLGRLIDYLPDHVVMLAASRHRPQFNLSRLRVSGAIVELGPDDLRFRSWEVERLFRDVYGERLPPEELAALARRTEGWAAGLQLFHLATRGKLPDERRRTLTALGRRWGLVREYLTDNVLADLPRELRAFLRDTCVLGRLSGPVCDELLTTTGSEAVLEQLERGKVFTQRLDDGWYRYHEVLRSHLEAVLVEELGEEAARARYQRAGALLEAAGALPSALSAYCRAEDWEAAARLLGDDGEAIALDPGSWLDRLPPALARQDPWLLLAAARRARAGGRWHDALRDLRSAETLFGSLPGAELCRKERLDLALWTTPALGVRTDWLGLLRTAVTREPLGVVAATGDSHEPHARLVRGLAMLAAGSLHQARLELAAAAEDSRLGNTLSIAARLASGAAALIAGDDSALLDVEWAAEEAERLGEGWLSRLGHALTALTVEGGRPTAQAAAAACREHGDAWGSGLAALVEGLGVVRSDTPSEQTDLIRRLDAARSAFAALDARTLVAWCTALSLLLRARHGEGDPAAIRRALATARASGVEGAEGLLLLALAGSDGRGRAGLARQAGEVLAECGIDVSVGTLSVTAPASAPTSPTPDGVASLTIRCFGQFQITVAGRPVELAAIKPQARRLLRLLALQAGRPVHREVLLSALWPDVEPEAGMRTLHVHLSSLRQALEPDSSRHERGLLARDGDAYRLVLPPDADCDLLAFDQAMAEGRRARSKGENARAVEAFQRALQLHATELLPEEGPSEWVIAERDRCRADVVDAAQGLGELLAAQGDRAGAVAACSHGLRADPYADVLWRMLIAIHEEDRDHAAAARARRRYEDILEQLGV